MLSTLSICESVKHRRQAEIWLVTRCRSFVFTLEEFDRELITLIQAMVDVSSDKSAMKLQRP